MNGTQHIVEEQYDFFWDKFQNYGKKEQYTYSFYGWYDGAYNPKYPIVCQKNWSTVDMFRGSHISDTLVDIEFNFRGREFHEKPKQCGARVVDGNCEHACVRGFCQIAKFLIGDVFCSRSCE